MIPRVHATEAEVFEDHLIRALDAFCIDPLKHDFKRLEYGLDKCFVEKLSKQESDCVISTIKVAWHEIRLKENPENLQEWKALQKVMLSSKTNCMGTLPYADMLGNCIDTATQNPKMASTVMFLTRLCFIDFEALEELKADIKPLAETMRDIVHVYEAECAELAQAFKD